MTYSLKLFPTLGNLSESLLKWVIVKTDIQRTSKVRSIEGLLLRVFGKIAAAFSYSMF